MAAVRAGLAMLSRSGRQVGCAVLAAIALVVSPVSRAQEAAPRVDPAITEGVGEGRAQVAPEKLADDIHETIARVPVDLKLMNGAPYRGEMVVTHFRPDGPGPFPVVVVSHGRSSSNRREPLRWRSVNLARYFTRRGFAVIVPTRVGYGALGQQVDPETAGVCSRAEYGAAVAAMATQVEAAARFGQELPWADRKRVLLVGASYGGFATIAGAARDIPGLIGAINFAGGMGGSPERRPGEPCQGDQISSIAEQSGAKTKVSTLWLYAENDRYWGEAWPKRWHEAFVKGGGRASFERFPPIADDGHKVMSQGFKLWRPVVDRYLASLGIAPPSAGSKVPESGYALLDEVEAVPFVKPETRAEAYGKFLAADIPRAFALSPTGGWAWRSGLDALEVAMKRCQTNSRSPCVYYAIDDRVVFKGERPKERP